MFQINVQKTNRLLIKKSLKNLIDVFTNDKNKTIDLASLMEKIKDQSHIEDPNIVKVIVDSNSNAIYFSRCAKII